MLQGSNKGLGEEILSQHHRQSAQSLLRLFENEEEETQESQEDGLATGLTDGFTAAHQFTVELTD